ARRRLRLSKSGSAPGRLEARRHGYGCAECGDPRAGSVRAFAGHNMEDVKLEFPALPQCKDDQEDWSYPMRREMQEILPGLFLGPYSAAMKSKLPILQKYGITHIICIRQSIEANFIKPNFQNLFRYLVLDIADNPIENIIRFFCYVKGIH
ncbi:unnamed protein product, partial [Staurois parvus]